VEIRAFRQNVNTNNGFGKTQAADEARLDPPSRLRTEQIC